MNVELSQQQKTLLNETEKQNEDRFKSIVFYENPLESDQQGVDYHFQGLLDLELVEESTKQAEADYYLCGPVPFMGGVHKKLTEWGVDKSRIHYEIFGSDKDLY